MKLANLAGRAVIVTDAGALDVERASGGVFGADVQALYERWSDLRAWADGCRRRRRAGAHGAAGRAVRPADLRSPVPAPRQVFGIGLNYREHAAEAGCSCRAARHVHEVPVDLAGPLADVELPRDGRLGGRAGRRDRRARPTRGRADGWEHVAGSPSARTSPTATCSSPPARSSRSASPSRASARWARGW